MTDTGCSFSIEEFKDESGLNQAYVKIVFESGEQASVLMTPQQARAFASDLIQTVYRAEVKSSLKHTKSSSATTSERIVQGPFPNSRIAGV